MRAVSIRSSRFSPAQQDSNTSPGSRTAACRKSAMKRLVSLLAKRKKATRSTSRPATSTSGRSTFGPRARARSSSFAATTAWTPPTAPWAASGGRTSRAGCASRARQKSASPGRTARGSPSPGSARAGRRNWPTGSAGWRRTAPTGPIRTPMTRSRPSIAPAGSRRSPHATAMPRRSPTTPPTS